MKQFRAFVRKEFFHILRDRWTMIILLLLPVVMLILFGFMITTEVRNTRFAIYDPSRDPATQAIVNKLAASEYFIFDGYLEHPDQIDAVFRAGKVGLIVVFSTAFHQNMMHTGDAQVQLIADGSEPNNANTVVMYASSIVNDYLLSTMKEGRIPFRIQPEVKFLYNPALKGAYNFVPGVMGMILMLICAMMTSVSIAREKEMGTMEVLLVSPMKPAQIMISKVVPYFFLSLVNLTTVLLISVFVMRVPIQGSFALLIMVSLLFIFVSLTLGLLISTVVDKQMTALLISAMVLMLPVIMLSGLMFPVENMPRVLRWMSEVIPAKWYIIAVKRIMIEGLGLEAVRREILVLAGMALLLVTLSLKRFNYRLE